MTVYFLNLLFCFRVYSAASKQLPIDEIEFLDKRIVDQAFVEKYILNKLFDITLTDILQD